MMQLSTMKKIVSTVDQDWRSPFAEQLLEKWGYDEKEVYYYRGSANFIFVFKREGQWHFLRCNESTERNLEDYQSELEILQLLENSSVRVTKPIRSKDGNLIETILTELGTYHCVVFEALNGEQLELEQLDENGYFSWGKTLGQLHQAFMKLPISLKESRPSWRDHIQFIKDTVPADEISFYQELHVVEEWLTNLPITDETFGLIHYDFELDNLKWNEQGISILDFDDSVQHWYVADIAYALRDLFEQEVDLYHPSFTQFMKGYSSENSVNLDLLTDLVWFMRLHHLVTFAKLYRSLDISNEDTNPKWLSELVSKFETKLENYRASFLKNK
ncbi:phosphotransferase [Bacillus luteolus]|uniref:Phosphotransferase n=1 Tax=Litchfieldia luteola TaxID=682179 RepID=A0ABR9QKQ2_9BACI|nr:phosphotransferase [Cytobacillus luteolus]MBE4909081.1 phosphotransferase [Cytobacillus luteolus]MBP1941937.1 Ser/Thr protein kinase RdoA (MazF antagonist) [Cytobacillus luteolus]